MWGLLAAEPCLAADPAPVATEQAALPWAPGDELAGWRIDAVDTHPEYLRLWLVKGDARTGLEIQHHGGPPGDWATTRHRLAPAPEESPPEELLVAAMAELRALEASLAPLSPPPAPPVPPPPPTPRWRADALLIAADLAALALAAACAGLVARRWREDRVGIGLAALGSAAAAAVWITIDPAALPMTWFGALQESGTAGNVRQLYGGGSHAGANLLSLLGLAAGGVADLRDVFRFNLALTLAAGALLVPVLRGASGSWWVTAALLAIYGANRLTWAAATSELPSALVNVLLLLGAAPVALLVRREGADRASDALALVTLAALTALVGATRVEVAGVGLVAIGVVLARAALGDARLDRAGERVVAAVRQRATTPVGLLVIVALVALPVVFRRPEVLARGAWLWRASMPLDPPLLYQQALVPTAYLPVPVVLLAALGVWRSMRRPLDTLLVPVAALLIWRVHLVASHDWAFERHRYFSLTVALALGIAALGARELGEIARRRGWSGRRLGLGFGAALLLPPLWSGAGALHADGQARHTLDPTGWLAATEHQEEVRLLREAAERWPSCALVTRVTVAETGPDRGGPPWRWMRFRHGVEQIELLPDESALDAPGAACVLFVRGLDCGLATSDGCAAMVDGREALIERVVPTTPFNAPDERGAYPARVTLGVYAVRGP